MHKVDRQARAIGTGRHEVHDVGHFKAQDFFVEFFTRRKMLGQRQDHMAHALVAGHKTRHTHGRVEMHEIGFEAPHQLQHITRWVFEGDHFLDAAQGAVLFAASSKSHAFRL